MDKIRGIDHISLYEIETLGERNVTKNLLKGLACKLIDEGKFELLII